MECKFNENGNEGIILIKFDGQEIVQNDRFHYLGSIIQNNEEIDKNICNIIITGWIKRRGASAILCDKQISWRIEGKYDRKGKHAMLYGSKCQSINKVHGKKKNKCGRNNNVKMDI